MARLPLGKLAPDLLSEVLGELLPEADALPREVVLGPRVGEDGCAIDVEGGTLVAATDPITMTGSDVGAHAVVINANDVAVMGARPRWFLATVLLPEGTTEEAVRALFAGLREALAGTGAALVGGHTEVTAAVAQPVVSGTMLGWTERGKWIRTGGLSPGDAVLQVGPAPVEGAAVLAESRFAAEVEPALVAAAREGLRDPGISVVEPALLSASLGATALHDPTEGGLATALHEMAEASGLAIAGLERDAVLWFEPGLALCRASGADPWGTLASGTLLAGFPAERAGEAEAALRSAGHVAARIGTAKAGSGVRDTGGREQPRFDRDELSRVL